MSADFFSVMDRNQTPSESSRLSKRTKDGAQESGHAGDAAEGNFHSAFLELAHRQKADAQEKSGPSRTADEKDNGSVENNKTEGAAADIEQVVHKTEDKQDLKESTSSAEDDNSEKEVVEVIEVTDRINKRHPPHQGGFDKGINVGEAPSDLGENAVKADGTTDAAKRMERVAGALPSSVTQDERPHGADRGPRTQSGPLRVDDGGTNNDGPKTGRTPLERTGVLSEERSIKQRNGGAEQGPSNAKDMTVIPSGKDARRGLEFQKTKSEPEQKGMGLRHEKNASSTEVTSRNESEGSKHPGTNAKDPSKDPIKTLGHRFSAEVSEVIQGKSSPSERNALGPNQSRLSRIFTDDVRTKKADVHNDTEARSNREKPAQRMMTKSNSPEIKGPVATPQVKETGDRRLRGKKITQRESAPTVDQERKKSDVQAVRIGSNASKPGNEHRFDRGSQKFETTTNDNTSPQHAVHTASSSKVSGPKSRFGDAEMVKKSFQENGFKQFVDKASLHLKNGQQEFKIELKPESLGHVKLQVSTAHHQVAVRIMAEHPVAKQLIENSLYQLKVELQAQGLQVDRIDVSLFQQSGKNGGAPRFLDDKRTRKGVDQNRNAEEPSGASTVTKNEWMKTHMTNSGALNLFA